MEVRDMGLLESAMAMPRASFSGQFLHGSIYEKAAAYLYHIVNNHPFVDGNKRTGAMAAFVFLALNDLDLTASNKKFEDLVMGVAKGEIDKSDVASFIRQHSCPLQE